MFTAAFRVNKSASFAPISPINPLALSPVLWYDGSDASSMSDGSTTSGTEITGFDVVPGGEIALWRDKSGNGNHLLGRVGNSAWATLKANVLNGRSVVDFKGNSQMVTVGNVAMSNTTAVTAFYIFKVLVRDYENAGKIFSMESENYLTRSLHCQMDANANQFGVGQFGDVLSEPAPTSVDNYHIWTTTHSTTLAANRLSLRRDGGTVVGGYSNIGNAAIPGSFPNLKVFLARADYSTDTTDPSPPRGQLNGEIAEILVYSRLLSSSERQSVEQYLSNKWDIPII